MKWRAEEDRAGAAYRDGGRGLDPWAPPAGDMAMG